MTPISRPLLLATASAACSLLTVALVVPSAHAADGDVHTFGANTFGQLGNGSVGGAARPTPVRVLQGASDVAGGREHTLALRAGQVWAWGADAKGAVGDGGAFQSAVNTPRQLSLSGVDSVSTGHYHSMALDRGSDTVWAWGWNSRGQMGPRGGTALKVGAPVQVALPGQVSMIAAGRAHSLAVVDGQVYAWGDNGSGQLGRAADGGRNPQPTLVKGLPSGVTWIAGGRDSSFAIAGGVLYAWGNNAYGQLGIGSKTSLPTPTRVRGSVAQVESGADHTVALLADGTVMSWGRNRYGQLGVSGTAIRTSPVAVAGLANITEVRVGRDHSMAIRLDGTFYAWGRNDGGQLGLGGAASRNTPTAIPAAAGAQDAGGGQVHTVILR